MLHADDKVHQHDAVMSTLLILQVNDKVVVAVVHVAMETRGTWGIFVFTEKKIE